MRQGIVVDSAPVTLHECRYQQQQRALGLMEVRHQHLHYLVLIARGNDNLRRRVQHGLFMTVEPVEERLKCHTWGRFPSMKDGCWLFSHLKEGASRARRAVSC